MTVSTPPVPLVTSPRASAMAPLSLAQAIGQVEQWTHLPDTRRRDLRSALCKAADMIGRPPADIPCTPEALNGLLFGRPPAAFGIGTARYHSVLSLLRAVMRELGCHKRFETGERGLGSAWRDFLAALPDGPIRAGLRNFARWCGRRGVAPMTVDTDRLAEFLDEDRRERLSAATASQGASLAAGWNRAIASQPDPGLYQPLAAPRRRTPYTLPVEAYPPSFGEDVAAFAARIARGGPDSKPFTNKGGPRRRAEPGTVKARVFAIRQAAAALVLSGVPIEAITSLRDLVQPIERAEMIIDFYFDRRQRTGSQLGQVAETLRQIAKFHTKLEDPEDQERLEELVHASVGKRGGGMTPKNRQRLAAITAPRALAMLLHLPQTLLRQARSAEFNPVEQARLARQALVIEMLTICPLRLGELRGLKLVENLPRLHGGSLPSHILVPETDTKNDAEVTWPLPRDTARMIANFVRAYRSALAAPGNPYLFSGIEAEPLSLSALRASLVDPVEREIGVRVHPHLMRHLAVYLFLKANPGQYETARRILGHKDVRTTIAYYCGLEAEFAARAFDELILNDRKRTRLQAQAAFRKGKSKRQPKPIATGADR